MPSNTAGATSPSVPDVSVVVTTHHEGVLAHATMRSLAAACRRASEAGLAVEVVVVLDRADDATRDYVASVVGEGMFDGAAQVSTLDVGHGDLGLARNAGLATARGEYAGTLDADNVVSRNWLVEGVHAARRDPGVVVHPDWIVSFGARRVLWPMIGTDDPRFDPALLKGHNYWDAFSLARRSLYLDHPYQRSGAGRGPEDWHWNIETVAAGVRHVTAPGTALFYRAKGAGSLMALHEGSGHLLAPAAMLLSPELAHRVVNPARPTTVPDDALDVVRRVLGTVPTPHVHVRPGAEGADFDPTHYRVLHHDLCDMSIEQVTTHWERYGRNEGRRALLSAEEVAALAEWSAEHYRLLNPDLADQDDEALLTHFLHHGRSEGRSGWVDAEGMDRLRRLRVTDYLALNPDLDAFTPEQAVAHYLTHWREERWRGTVRPAADPEVPDWLPALWAEAHDDEPGIPVPTKENLDSYGFYGVEPRLEHSPAVGAWWHVVDRLGPTPARRRLVVLAEDTEAPGLSEHLAAVRSVDPDAPVAVVVTGTAPAPTTPDPAGVSVVRLADVPEFLDLDRFGKARLIADLAVQLQPRALHLWGNGPAFDALEWHGAAMSHGSDIHLTVTGEGLEGPLAHPLLGRPPGYLGPVSRVWVDSPDTVDALWEIARLPREVFVVQPTPSGLADELRALPAYGPDDVEAPDRVHASELTATLLAGHDPVALVVTGYEGFANFGDILQAKNLSRFWRARGVTPVHLVSASAVRYPADLEACRLDVGSEHVLVSGWDAAPPPELGLSQVRQVSPGSLLHVGGGGYLNRHWLRQRMRGIERLVALAGPRALVVSGLQVDRTALKPLTDLMGRLPPVIVGARDERSRTLLEETTDAVAVRGSFDDASELILDWAAADPLPPAEGRTGQRFGLHLNTSDYAADESVLDVVRGAFERIREEDPAATLTVLHAYDDDRPEVADSLETLSKFRAHFPFDRYAVVDLARAARDLDLDDDVTPSLAQVRRLDLAIVASYHTAVLLGLLGVPTHLLATNSFYEDKAAGLGQTATLEDFLADPTVHGISLESAREARQAWLRDLDEALGTVRVTAPRPPSR